LVLSLCEVEAPTPNNNSTALVGEFDNKVRVGPKRAKCNKFGRRHVRVVERSGDIETADVTPTVYN